MPNREEAVALCQGRDRNTSSSIDEPNGEQSELGLDSQYSQSEFVQTQHGQSQYGQSKYGQSQYGQSQYGKSKYGQSQNVSSQNVQPQYGPQQPNQSAYVRDIRIFVEEKLFEDPVVRKTFILHTYYILMLDLNFMLWNLAGAAITDGAYEFLIKPVIGFPILGISVISYVWANVSSCCGKKYMMYAPWSVVLNIVTTISLTGFCMLGQAYYAHDVVAIAIGAILGMELSIMLLVWLCPVHLKNILLIMFAVLMIFVIFGAIVLFQYIKEGDFNLLHYILACVISCAFSVGLVAAMNILMDNHRINLGPGMHWYGATMLLLNIQLALWLMEKISRRKAKKIDTQKT